jgi:hypothetical protein
MGSDVAALVAAGPTQCITTSERNRITTEMKSRQAGHAAGRADREQGCESAVLTVNTNVNTGSGAGGPEPEPEPAVPVATPTVAATASSPPPLPAAGGRDDRPAQATPEAPEDDDEVAMVMRQIDELRRREDEPVRELERIIDKQRKRDAGYVVPASVNKAIVTRWTGRSA